MIPTTTNLLPPGTDLLHVIANKDGKFIYPGNLKHYFSAVFDESTNQELPYHGLSHETHVAWECADGALWHYERALITPKGIRELIVAGLYHDANHSPRCVSDQAEIHTAITFLQQHLADEDALSYSKIQKIIWTTEFSIPRKPLINPSIEEQIIYDVDLTQALNTFWMQQVLFGLGKELVKTPREMIAMQEGFLKSIKFQTEWARQKYGPLITKKIDQTQRLKEILGMKVD